MSELFGKESVNFKVCIRVRPFIQRELKNIHSQESCIHAKKGCLEFFRGLEKKSFHFDYVGGETVDQATIFNHIAKPIAKSCLDGYNGTIFAYGQTGAGKTFTIQGPIIDRRRWSNL